MVVITHTSTSGTRKSSAILKLSAPVLLMLVVLFVSNTMATGDPPESRASRHRSTGHDRNQRQSAPTDESAETDGASSQYNCSAREAKRNFRYQSIREDILRKLRLSAPPNITGRTLPAIPHLRTIIEQMCRQKDASCVTDGLNFTVPHRPAGDEDLETDDYHATTVKMLQFPVSLENSAIPEFIQFRFQPDIANSEVVKAEFGVYVRHPASISHPPSRSWLLVYRLMDSALRYAPPREMVHQRRILLNDDHTGIWYRFNLTQLVTTWITDPSTNHGLVVQVGEQLAVTTPRDSTEDPYKPYIELHLRSNRQLPRSKRTTDLNCDDLSAEHRCCRYPLVVDFDSFGWEWIIVPRRYSAYYCSGECPFLYMQSNGPHTHIRQQVGGGGPCCAPRRVSSISMLYYDQFMNIVYGNLPGMVVDQCGCA